MGPNENYLGYIIGSHPLGAEPIKKPNITVHWASSPSHHTNIYKALNWHMVPISNISIFMWSEELNWNV